MPAGQQAALYCIGHSVEAGQQARYGATVFPQSVSISLERHEPLRRIAQPGCMAMDLFAGVKEKQ